MSLASYFSWYVYGDVIWLFPFFLFSSFSIYDDNDDDDFDD